jgi:hypothetical protein
VTPKLKVLDESRKKIAASAGFNKGGGAHSNSSLGHMASLKIGMAYGLASPWHFFVFSAQRRGQPPFTCR